MRSRSDVLSRTFSTKRVFVIGATGTIGRATVRALVERGHEVVCLVRPRAGPGQRLSRARSQALLEGAEIRFGDAADPVSLALDGIRGERFDALISCIASRTGVPQDAWAIDYRANAQALAQAKNAEIGQMVLLSAICVQKPLLAFQKAKLAFEAELIGSGLVYSIVRPTAFFKSLSGQIGRVRAGKPFLTFGDGTLTASKPIGDADLGQYLVRCLEDEALQNRILPIGGPGPAITPQAQGEHLFALLGRTPKFRRIPPSLLTSVSRVLRLCGRLSPSLAVKGELARIGHYYATESMLVLDPQTGRYDADKTPSTGRDTLFDFYRRVIETGESPERGDHAAF
ncbi:NAD(P)H-binding protein [Fulvimarina sp. 2208YS6-2-32]|uniref:Divinyl chlorophyllide a 8-vinyl-reductase, chloroplastic n=1 Tax=Fulvimarina uroteuthidis TaxID=3098149 RepID=A0ABU5I1F3_9HYPH|nr:NAD(P)H-binding protein [Fulvimarina sp. 2208YS6-2-32]MDY8109160.1 NAD(P)H-binding protein [Fulvimarina sp. 2208YS6-2-32]